MKATFKVAAVGVLLAGGAGIAFGVHALRAPGSGPAAGTSASAADLATTSQPGAPGAASATAPLQALQAQLATMVPKGRAAPELSNMAAYLPAQCYASTIDAPADGDHADRAKRKPTTHNGCFACHQASLEPNFTSDEDIQTTLSLPQYATENRWTNMKQPPAPVAISDSALVDHVRTSNYFDANGGLRLADKLSRPPAEWDANGDGRWGGYTPDCWFDVDDAGFDHAPDGRATGWRAFAYAPFPGMFWPTNGSAGDVLIRLPPAYRQDRDGRENETIHRLNFAILEAFIRRVDVPVPPTDEQALGSDLDGDGKLGMATRVAFVWPPKEGRPFGYVGAAAALDPKIEGWPAAGLFPRGTEFLHSLRYLDVKDGQVGMAARMKELRYMRKVRWQSYGDLSTAAQLEAREKQKSPDRLKTILGDAERGVGTGTGWLMQGFIEDAGGDLRPQTVEETAACIGCHGGVGSTTDSTFAFARKLDARAAYRAGWYHWGERGLAGIAEPKRADGKGEYAHWLAQVGGGDDYRSNEEVKARFFRNDGSLDPAATARLARDISTLLVPSPERAIALDRAYLAMVKDQHFERGRDVVLGTPKIESRVEQDGPTGIEEPVTPGWKKPAKSASR